ncbi:MAG: septum site-determining protein MinC [Thioploca sp.]|nr:septum site-determining protein MinC [Thioploca sp.]
MPSLSHNWSTPALELKGSLLTLMILRLFETDSERIAEQLVTKIAQAPGLFQQAPVVIDLQALPDDNQSIDLIELIRLLRLHGLIPVAIRGGNSQQHQLAVSLNLGIMIDNSRAERPRRYPEPEPVVASPPCLTKIVTHPIRSGQQVVALQGDLIVLATVSHGAEILAQRHIHVYGALRGRALAGVNGDGEARIFCQQLDAELVSIAGQYQINEELANHLRGKPAQVYLDNDTLKIEPL